MVLDSPDEGNLPIYLRSHNNLLRLDKGHRNGHEWLSPEVIADHHAGIGAHTLLAEAQRREVQDTVRGIQHNIARADRRKDDAMLGLVRKGLIAMPPAEALSPMRSQASLASSQHTVSPSRIVSSSSGTIHRDSATAEAPHAQTERQPTTYTGEGLSTNKVRQERPSVKSADPGPSSGRHLRNSSQPQAPYTQTDPQPKMYTGDSHKEWEPGLVDNIDAQRRAIREGKRPIGYSLPDGCPPPPVPARDRAQQPVSFERNRARYPSATNQETQTSQMPQMPEPAWVAGTPSPVSSLDSNQRLLKSAVNFGSAPDPQLNPPNAPIDLQPTKHMGDGYRATPTPHKQRPPFKLPAAMTSKIELKSVGYIPRHNVVWGFEKYCAEMRAMNSHPSTPAKVPLRSMSETMPSIADCEFVKFGGRTGTVPFGRPIIENNIGHKGYVHAERPQAWIPEWRARALEEERQRQVREQSLQPERARYLVAGPPRRVGQWDTRPFYDYPKEITPRCGPRKVVSTGTVRPSPMAKADSDDLSLSEVQRRLKRDQPSRETLETLSSTVTASVKRSASAATRSSAATVIHSPKPHTTAQEEAVNGHGGETLSLRSRYKRKSKFSRSKPPDPGLDDTPKALLRIKAFSLSNLTKRCVRDSPKRSPRIVQPSEAHKSEQTAIIPGPVSNEGQVVQSSETQEPAKPPNPGDKDVKQKPDSKDSAYSSMETGLDALKEIAQGAACTALVVSGRSAVNHDESDVRSEIASRIPVAVPTGKTEVVDVRAPRLSSASFLSIGLLALVFFLKMLSLREYLMLLCLVLVVIYGITGAKNASR